MSGNPNYPIVCPIWGTMAAYPCQPSSGRIFYYSPRAGGQFSMTRITQSYINEIRARGHEEIPINMNPRKMLRRIDVAVKARLTSCLIEKRYLGEEFPEVTYHLIQRAQRRRPLRIIEKADKLLIYLTETESFPQFQCPDYREDLGYFLRSLAYIESKYNKNQENDGQKEI